MLGASGYGCGGSCETKNDCQMIDWLVWGARRPMPQLWQEVLLFLEDSVPTYLQIESVNQNKGDQFHFSAYVTTCEKEDISNSTWS